MCEPALYRQAGARGDGAGPVVKGDLGQVGKPWPSKTDETLLSKVSSWGGGGTEPADLLSLRSIQGHKLQEEARASTLSSYA